MKQRSESDSNNRFDGKKPRRTKHGITVYYPLETSNGDLVLRTDVDWGKDIEPVSLSDSSGFHFEVATDRPFFYFKPGIHRADGFVWSRGANYLALLDSGQDQEIYPFFSATERGAITHLVEVASRDYDVSHRVRIYLPAGYSENTLKRYPVLYMHDGNNLFFPREAFMGQTWNVDGTLDLLDAMNVIREVIVIGVWPADREREYTRPGYEQYSKFLATELKPRIDREYRTLSGAENCAVMGSSLGGVVSLYVAWQYPNVFGKSACLSSTFDWEDNLRERIMREPRREVKLYLDSGVPDDNFEVTMEMTALLLRRGYSYGSDLLYFAFPNALHNEKSWAMRIHIPFQYFFGTESSDGSQHPFGGFTQQR